MRLRLMRRFAVACVLGLATVSLTVRAEDPKPIRVGLIGLDNYQVVEFTNFFNNPNAEGDLKGLLVVAGWRGGSPEIEDSLKLVERWVPYLSPPEKSEKPEAKKKAKKPAGPTRPNVAILDKPEEVIKQSDAIIVMSMDARQHLEQARWAIRAKKPVFVGRPFTASLADAVRLVQEAEAAGVPIFSCSQHRFSPGFVGMRNHPEVGKVLGVDVYGACPREPHHPDLTWHAIHGVETLYTIMGPGCVSVTRIATDKADVVTGTWADGRVGVYRGIREGAVKYSAVVFGEKGVSVAGIYGHGVPVKGVVPTNDAYMGYKTVAGEIAKFFKTNKPPVTNAELLEVYSFLEAAEESKRQKGAPVTLASVLAKAKAEVAAHPQK